MKKGTRYFLYFFFVLAMVSGAGMAYLYHGVYLRLPEVQERQRAFEPAQILELEAISVPVMRKAQIVRYVVFRISLEFETEVARVRAQERQVQLRDAFLSEFMDYLSLLPASRPINLTTVRLRLERATRNVTAEKGLKLIRIRGVFEYQG